MDDQDSQNIYDFLQSLNTGSDGRVRNPAQLSAQLSQARAALPIVASIIDNRDVDETSDETTNRLKRLISRTAITTDRVCKDLGIEKTLDHEWAYNMVRRLAADIASRPGNTDASVDALTDQVNAVTRFSVDAQSTTYPERNNTLAVRLALAQTISRVFGAIDHFAFLVSPEAIKGKAANVIVNQTNRCVESLLADKTDIGANDHAMARQSVLHCAGDIFTSAYNERANQRLSLLGHDGEAQRVYLKNKTYQTDLRHIQQTFKQGMNTVMTLTKKKALDVEPDFDESPIPADNTETDSRKRTVSIER
mgnify:CR=1 FL=1